MLRVIVVQDKVRFAMATTHFVTFTASWLYTITTVTNLQSTRRGGVVVLVDCSPKSSWVQPGRPRYDGGGMAEAYLYLGAR